ALARMMGMRVETFSLGFGPRIWGFRHGETDYRLSALPLGGYCKIAGFTPDDPAAQDPNDTGSYMNKPAWRRFLVIAAGPGVNYFVAFLIIAVLYASNGFLDLTTSHIQVVPGGPAGAARRLGPECGDGRSALGRRAGEGKRFARRPHRHRPPGERGGAARRRRLRQHPGEHLGGPGPLQLPSRAGARWRQAGLPRRRARDPAQGERPVRIGGPCRGSSAPARLASHG